MNKLFVSSFLILCFASFSERDKALVRENSEANFSITIKSNGKGSITINGTGDKLTRGFISKKGKGILIGLNGTSGSKPTGDNILLNIFGETSGDYKFDFNPKVDKSRQGHAFFQFNPTSAPATKLGFLYSTSGVLHLTVSSNSCSGTIQATTTNNCEVSGSFNNISLQEKN